MLEPGDILLVRREGYLSNIGIPGFWPHAVLYVGTPEERRRAFADPEVAAWVQARGQPDGDFEALLARTHPAAHARAVAPDGDAPRRALEAISEGVVFTTLEHAAGADHVAALRPRLPAVEKAAALLRAFGYAGRPYDFNFDFRTDAALVCSELVYKAYEPGPGRQGLRLPLVEVLGRPVLPPNEIARLFDAELGTPAAQLELVRFLDGWRAGRGGGRRRGGVPPELAATEVADRRRTEPDRVNLKIRNNGPRRRNSYHCGPAWAVSDASLAWHRHRLEHSIEGAARWRRSARVVQRRGRPFGSHVVVGLYFLEELRGRTRAPGGGVHRSVSIGGPGHRRSRWPSDHCHSRSWRGRRVCTRGLPRTARPLMRLRTVPVSSYRKSLRESFTPWTDSFPVCPWLGGALSSMVSSSPKPTRRPQWPFYYRSRTSPRCHRAGTQSPLMEPGFGQSRTGTGASAQGVTQRDSSAKPLS